MQKKGGKPKHHHKATTKKAGKSERCEAAAAASSVQTNPLPQLPGRGSYGNRWCAALGIPVALCAILSLVLLVLSIATLPDLEGIFLFDLLFAVFPPLNSVLHPETGLGSVKTTGVFGSSVDRGLKIQDQGFKISPRD